MSDEGDFKKGRATPLLVGGLAVVLVGGGIIYLAKRTSETTLRPEEVRTEVNKILIKPLSQQTKDWRELLEKKDEDERLRQEAIFQLARLRDKDSLPVMKKLLADTSNHATTRVLSMALLEFPRADVADAKPTLEKKFDGADSSDLPQVASALVYIRDKDYFQKVFDTYKKDVMKSAKGVDGSASFDPVDLAELTDRATFRKFATDPQAGVRQLVAVVLSTKPAADDLDTLKTLLQDADIEISAAASVGIAKLNDKSASQILVDKLAAAQKEDNENASKRYMEALKNGIGGAGLVYALEVVPQDTQNSEERGRFVLEQLRELADPSAAPAYKRYIENKSNPPHYRSQIALALADIGDPDAVKYLADRMDAKGIGFRCDSTSIEACWTNNLGWKKQPPVDADPVTYREQQFSAQDIGDMAVLYPAKKAEFAQLAVAHLTKFNSWFPAPWLVVSRASAYLGDPDTLDWCKDKVRKFKLPDVDLVDLGNDPKCGEGKRGCTIFSLNELATAQRFVGLAKDPSLVDALSKFLARPKTKKGTQLVGFSDLELENVTNPGFRQAYMQAAQGAADGLAEWGAEAGKATDDLLKAVKDKDQGSWIRLMSGRALGRVASEKDLLAAVKDAKGWNDNDAKVAVLMGAQGHATPDIAAAALEMIVPTNDVTMLAVNNWAARVVGWAGTKGLEDRLLKMMDDKGTRLFAALAIVLGGDEDLVRRGMLTFEQKARAEQGGWDGELHTLQGIYLDTFDSRGLSMDDVESGRLYRFVRNAETLKRAGASDDANEAGHSNHEWASIYLQAGFKRLDMNATVPGGVDKLILRWKLNQAAKTGDEVMKQAAIDTLKFLKEQGSIMALRDEAGSTGEMARKAFFELRHPEVAQLGDKEKAEGEKDDPYFSKPKK
ncbi:MAG: hypothetical protein NVSMB47_12800 [Polyangiales bacterium]